ncbi:phosphoenolpyruvate--protein phosphotransferase [Thermomonas sp.]|uniref:phosphoenolpyruvate--protein phosphotransferase n=1 Tax=Thermomonas sp. TaxID=1971895 RepID=UPI002B7E536A|nr:phosphoenolpyruvate--protein phosphotransferase [Thermomonas sp.]HRO64189.1 phosphoenolpyruvate--protein phosphotransferase [Thermomonas sp.]
MRQLLSGVAAARGCALGRARMRLPHRLEIEVSTIAADAVAAEIARFRAAVAEVRAEMRALRERLQGALASELGDFVDLHALLLDDPELLSGIDTLIRTGPYSADYALRLQRNRITAAFEEMDDAYLRSRIDDIDHIIERLHGALHNRKAALPGVSGDILITDNIAPAELALLQAQGVVGVVTAAGSPLSHSTIMARSLHLPLVVGASQALLKARDGDVLLLDGGSGLVILEPDAADLRAHHARVTQVRQERRQLNRLRREPSRTLDGVDIKLWANAETRDDASEAHALGAAGIGLFRSEFLFLGRGELPDEETQFRAYRDVVLAMTGRMVTIRTLDLGADKAERSGLALRQEANPALGLRGVRLSLALAGMLRTQLRAIVRASGYGPVRVLIPMLSGIEELQAVRSSLDNAMRELRAEGREIAAKVPLGTMIEVPAAALALPSFLKLADFLAIGSNDLVQYLLAADRTNEALEALYTPLHPAVLRVLHDVTRTARRRGVPVTLCGEIAAEPAFAPLLLALGLDELSLHPSHLLEVRQAIRGCELTRLRADAPALLRARTRAGIERWLDAHRSAKH